jgi:hypothetical protein
MPADASDLRRSVYLLLGAAAVAVAAAKVVGAELVYEPTRYKATEKQTYGAEPKREWPRERPDPTPMFSSNDKSRWATVRSLVDHTTYVIGKRTITDPQRPDKYIDEGILTEPAYKTLDVVMNPDTKEFYSSKPPLFSTVLAGGYWALKKAFGWSIVRDRWLVIPTLLVVVNVVPFAVYLALLAGLIETVGKSDFGKLTAFTAACFGTFVTAFSGTLNNHTPAVFCVLFAIYPIVRAAAENRDMGPGGYVAAGLFSGLAVTFELPAAALLAGIGLPLLVARWKPTLLIFLPLALIPIGCLFLTNYLAFGELVPAYSKFGGPWYEYEGSHWTRLKLPVGHPDRRGIDFAAEPKDLYAFHLLLGHHGWFSLTPVWILGAVGLVMTGAGAAKQLDRLAPGGKGAVFTPPLVAAMTLAVSAVVMAFYIARTNNYGGNTSGPRWLVWLTPLWLIAVPTAADRLAGSRWGRLLVALLLGVSVLSVFYPAWNPWRPSWIQQMLEFRGELRY